MKKIHLSEEFFFSSLFSERCLKCLLFKDLFLLKKKNLIFKKSKIVLRMNEKFLSFFNCIDVFLKLSTLNARSFSLKKSFIKKSVSLVLEKNNRVINLKFIGVKNIFILFLFKENFLLKNKNIIFNIEVESSIIQLYFPFLLETKIEHSFFFNVKVLNSTIDVFLGNFLLKRSSNKSYFFFNLNNSKLKFRSYSEELNHFTFDLNVIRLFLKNSSFADVKFYNRSSTKLKVTSIEQRILIVLDSTSAIKVLPIIELNNFKNENCKHTVQFFCLKEEVILFLKMIGIYSSCLVIFLKFSFLFNSRENYVF